MKRKLYILVIYVFVGVVASKPCFLGAQVVKATTAATEESSDYFPDLETQLASLDTVINVAIKNSPFIKADSALIESNKYNVKLERLSWLDDISAFGNYATGNQKFGVLSGPTDHQTNFLNGYRYGVNLNIPISDFTTRKFKVRLAQAQVNSLLYQREQTQLEIKRQVTAEYNNLIAAQKILKIKSESLENFRVLHQLAEKQFKEGNIPLEDYAYASDLVVKAETEYEMSKSNFKTLYQQLEYLVGVRLSTLMKKR